MESLEDPEGSRVGSLKARETLKIPATIQPKALKTRKASTLKSGETLGIGMLKVASRILKYPTAERRGSRNFLNLETPTFGRDPDRSARP